MWSLFIKANRNSIINEIYHFDLSSTIYLYNYLKNSFLGASGTVYDNIELYDYNPNYKEFVVAKWFSKATDWEQMCKVFGLIHCHSGKLSSLIKKKFNKSGKWWLSLSIEKFIAKVFTAIGYYYCCCKQGLRVLTQKASIFNWFLLICSEDDLEIYVITAKDLD